MFYDYKEDNTFFRAGYSIGPGLMVWNVVKGQVYRILINFFYTGSEELYKEDGFTFEIEPTNTDQVTPLTGPVGEVGGGGKGQMVTKTVLFTIGDVENADIGQGEVTFQVKVNSCKEAWGPVSIFYMEGSVVNPNIA
ncbi:hypothetical protein KAR48_05365 [bacterium]|nr:hypothetical protein [bacterium]